MPHYIKPAAKIPEYSLRYLPDTTLVCTGAGVFYLVAFMLMCRKVKEGKYPAPEYGENPGLIRSFALYFTECLQIPLYRNYFIGYVLVTMGTACASPFITLFAKSTLGIGMDGMGQIFAWTAAVSTITFFPVGWICDRYFPMPVAIGSIVALAVASALALCVHNQTGFYIYSVLFALPTVGWQLSSLAVNMKLFPAEKFGQFSSGTNVFGCGALILGNYFMGGIIDLFGSDYRLSFVWSTVSYTLAIPIMIQVYRSWRQKIANSPEFVSI